MNLHNYFRDIHLVDLIEQEKRRLCPIHWNYSELTIPENQSAFNYLVQTLPDTLVDETHPGDTTMLELTVTFNLGLPHWHFLFQDCTNEDVNEIFRDSFVKDLSRSRIMNKQTDKGIEIMLIPEVSAAGRLHYHGVLIAQHPYIWDCARWIDNNFPKLYGRTECKSIINRQRYIEYFTKDYNKYGWNKLLSFTNSWA